MLLLWDDLSAHWTEVVRACARELNVVLVPVPPGCVSVCQPAEISWNKPLKSRLRAKWIDSLQAQLKQPREPTQKFKLPPPSRKDVTEWVTSAWANMPERVIKSGFSFLFKSMAPVPGHSDEQASEPESLAAATQVATELEGLGQLGDEEVGTNHDSVQSFLDKAVAGESTMHSDDDQEEEDDAILSGFFVIVHIVFLVCDT